MKTFYLLLVSVSLVAAPAHGQGTVSAKQSDVMKQLLATYAQQARAETRDAKGKAVKPWTQPFSAEVGREFYLKRRTWELTDFTCSGCHTENPAKEGKHIETKKPIKPLAPTVNPERFTDAKKVEKNFTEHCIDLHERDCYAYEKGNFITYLMSVK